MADNQNILIQRSLPLAVVYLYYEEQRYFLDIEKLVTPYFHVNIFPAVILEDGILPKAPKKTAFFIVPVTQRMMQSADQYMPQLYARAKKKLPLLGIILEDGVENAFRSQYGNISYLNPGKDPGDEIEED